MTTSLAAPAVAPTPVTAPSSEFAMPKPHPLHLVFTAGPQNVLNNIYPGDFSAAALVAPRMGLNDPSQDKFFLCTFKWTPPGHCCKITRAILTVNLKANVPGVSLKDSMAGNDTIGIVRNGVSVPGYSETVYTHWPFAAGQPSIKTWTLDPAELAHMNTDHRLSFNVQDDTMVQSATLELWGCCLDK
ncbi:MAG: hypothetical protein Q8922_01865 [Bacteroidota bacterium]|nr:hypothetical protein [Bacteroidota bacterium]MDP4232026.1 hypothetical protein [Bacteroidota bacterium]MDP4241267.1 hypothetical protein [Bacteroidota bacterium]MDP4286659.1 hypothetical protein [Bacteroidota bacterium]